MIANTKDISLVRPFSENIDDEHRLLPYLKEVEINNVLKFIGAGIYRQLDFVANTDTSTVETIEYINTEGKKVTITKAQNDIIFDGGYFTKCGCDCDLTEHTRGLKAAIVFLAYSKCLINANVNLTAFGAREQKLTFSQPLDETTLMRAHNEASKTGYSILQEVKKYLISLDIISCCKKDDYVPGIKFLSITDDIRL